MAPVFARLFDEPQLVGLISLAALVFIIAPAGQQFRILLERDLQFKTLAKIEIPASLAGTFIAVVAAVSGVGAASVILGTLGTASVTAALLAWRGWRRNRPAFHCGGATILGDTWGFGLYQMGERSLSYLGQNIDYLLIGGFLGPSALGVYTISYQVVVIAQRQINPVLTRIAFPIFAKRRNDNAALRRGFLELSRLLAYLSFPLLVGLAIVAPQAVPVLFGDEWDDAIVLIQILSILGVFKAIGNPMGSLSISQGASGYCLLDHRGATRVRHGRSEPGRAVWPSRCMLGSCCRGGGTMDTRRPGRVRHCVADSSQVLLQSFCNPLP